ncbi:hypothetical protein BVY01_02255 [bacterium I07]|nr:hypothetical protein BVY01_02255 [bacterium I07]
MKKIILFMVLTVMMVVFIAGRKANHKTRSTDDQYTLENCVNTFSPERVKTTTKGFQFWYVPKAFTGHLNLKLSHVDKKTANHPPHDHDESEIFYILEGKAEIHLNGKTRIIGEKSSFYCPAGSSHGIRNAGDKPLEYLVIKNN